MHTIGVVRARGFPLAGLVVAASLLGAAPAHGAAVIGSDLATPATVNTFGCNLSCTTASAALIASSTAPAGLTSPVNGKVTSWSVKSGSAGNTIRLRVLRPAGVLTFTGEGTSAPGTTVSGIAGPFPTSLPILAGDQIGLDSPNAALVMGVNGGGTQVYWTLPTLLDGATLTGQAGPSREVLVQAVVEPENKLDFGRIVRNKKKGFAFVFVEVPNAGELAFGGKLVKVGTRRTTLKGDGTIKIKVKATGRKLKTLKKSGKVGVKPILTFTPFLGTARSEPLKLKLKRKRTEKR